MTVISRICGWMGLLMLAIPSTGSSAPLKIASPAAGEGRILAEVARKIIVDEAAVAPDLESRRVDDAIAQLKKGQLDVYVGPWNEIGSAFGLPGETTDPDRFAAALKSDGLLASAGISGSVFIVQSEFAEGHPVSWAALQQLKTQMSPELMGHLLSLVRNDRKTYGESAAIFVDSLQWRELQQRREQAPALEKEGVFRGYLDTTRGFWARIWRHTIEHLALVGAALTLSIVVGVPLGAAFASRPGPGQWALVGTGVIQSIPSLALLCILLPFLGFGWATALAGMVMYGIFPVMRETAAGFSAIRPDALTAAKALEMPRWKRLILVKIPQASPYILKGARISAVVSVGTATVAALVGVGGYGALMITGLTLNDLQVVLQGALPAALLALLVHVLFDVADVLLIPKRLRGTPPATDASSII